MINISKEEVRHTAKLARLSLTDKEVDRYTEQLSIVFSYVNMLEEIDIEDLVETCQVTGKEDVFRLDESSPINHEMRQRIIAQFPQRLGNLLRVKGVFEDR